MAKDQKTFPIGRDAETGKFKPVDEAKRDREGSVVERIPVRQPEKKTGK
jgi:hypothetical protein